MALIVVERSFERPVDAAAFHACSDSDAAESPAVVRLVSYVAAGGLRMVCLYEAPNEATVRDNQGRLGLAWEAIWEGESCGEEGILTSAGGLETVAVTRAHDVPVAVDDVRQRTREVGGCMLLYRVTPRMSLLARGGLRQLCLFTAPDAEAVRIANRASSLDFDDVFKARIHVAGEDRPEALPANEP